MHSLLPRELLYTLADKLLGTPEFAANVAYELGYGEFDESDLEDELLNVNVERCPFCQWWCESASIVIDEDGIVAGCTGCISQMEEDAGD